MTVLAIDGYALLVPAGKRLDLLVGEKWDEVLERGRSIRPFLLLVAPPPFALETPSA